MIEADLVEMQRHEVCERRGDRVEICDRFWPYQKQIAIAAGNPQVEFVRQAREAFLKPALGARYECRSGRTIVAGNDLTNCQGATPNGLPHFSGIAPHMPVIAPH